MSDRNFACILWWQQKTSVIFQNVHWSRASVYVCPSPHSHTTGWRECPLVVHYCTDLQLVHGFRCNDNIALNGKCQRVLVLVLCLFNIFDSFLYHIMHVWMVLLDIYHDKCCVFLVTRRRSYSFAEYWKHFVARFNEVRASGYNSAGSERIWMKFGV